MKSIFSAFFFLICIDANAAIPNKAGEAARCESAKEFITTYEFLRSESDLAGSGDNALKVASQVAEGCTGAAQRFIQIVKFLKRAEVSYQEVLTTAIDFAKKEDVNVEAFSQIFKRSYATDGFDLDLSTSLTLAKRISIEYSGSVEAASYDFETVSAFCLDGKEVSIPKPACAELAKRISLCGKDNAPHAGEVFIQSYKFIKSTVGLAPHEALKLAEDLVEKDPQAFENFKLSYEYAMAGKGLKANQEQAIQFGKKMADLTLKEIKSSDAK